MGLREINAARTRKLISDAAIELFTEEGYESVTMEQVAHHADVSYSTLYRYFAAKEELVVAPLGDVAAVGDELRRRGREHPGEPLEVTLGQALIVFLGQIDTDAVVTGRMQDLMRDHPRPRARLAEWVAGIQEHVEQALAEVSERPGGDPRCAMLGWTAIFVVQRATAEWGKAGRQGDLPDAGRRVLSSLSALDLRLPRLEP